MTVLPLQSRTQMMIWRIQASASWFVSFLNTREIICACRFLPVRIDSLYVLLGCEIYKTEGLALPKHKVQRFNSKSLRLHQYYSRSIRPRNSTTHQQLPDPKETLNPKWPPLNRAVVCEGSRDNQRNHLGREQTKHVFFKSRRSFRSEYSGLNSSNGAWEYVILYQ